MAIIKNDSYTTRDTTPTNDMGREAAYEGVKEIKKDIDSLKTNLVGIAHKAIDTGADGVNEARKQAGVQFDRLRAAGANGLKATEERVREKPAQSIAVAFIAGILLNAFFGRR